MIKWHKEDVGNGSQNNMIAWAEADSLAAYTKR